MAQTKTATAKKSAAKSSTKKAPAKKKAAAKSTKVSKATTTKKKPAASKKKAAADEEVKLDRRRSAERRDKAITAEKTEATAEKTAVKPALERREKVNRRRQIDPTTCERDYSDNEVEFMNALDAYKRSSGRMFPTCSEVLEVVRGIGYVQLSQGELAMIRAQRGEDDIEESAAADASEALAESAELRVD